MAAEPGMAGLKMAADQNMAGNKMASGINMADDKAPEQKIGAVKIVGYLEKKGKMVQNPTKTPPKPPITLKTPKNKSLFI